MNSLNVADKANLFLDLIKTTGYKYPVRNIEKEGIWHPEYAIFILEFKTPNFNHFYNEDEDEYTQPPQFDKGRFYKNFVNYLQETFPNCKIKRYEHLDEYEIMGPNYREFYDEHLDALEELACKTDKHCVYAPRKNDHTLWQ